MHFEINQARRTEQEHRRELQEYVQQQWRLVRVESLETPATTEGVMVARARARIELGRLSPADVLVELVRLDVEEAPRRMWSAWSAGGGHFVFEATLPPGSEARDAHYRVQVRPNAARVGDAPLEPVTGPDRAD